MTDSDANTAGASARWRRWTYIGLVLALTAAFVGAIVVRVERSFLIEARTTGASITFAGIGTAWNFATATLCIPRPVPDLRQVRSDEGVCGADLYLLERVADETFDWPDGMRVDVHVDTDGAFVVEYLQPLGERPEGTLVIVSAEDWQMTGALTFRGLLTVGEVMASGARHFLQDGRWEARETGWATSLVRGGTQVVKEGVLSLGAEVTVVTGGAPAVMYGHLTPGADGTAMEVAAISQPGDTALRLSHFGFEKPSIIRPDWIDTALASPILLAVVAVLGLMTSLMQVLGDLVFGRRATRAQRGDAGS